MEGNGQRPYEAETSSDDEYAENISVEQLQRLVRLLDSSDVSEIEVKHKGARRTRLVLRKARASGSSGQTVIVEPTTANTAGMVPKMRLPITASLVGIFHSWARPKGGALVAVGDHVKVGQLVGTIQSLNVLNEVEAMVAGHIVEIFVQDGQPVEYGQPLMTVDSAEEA